MDEHQLKRIIEALILSSNEPLSVDELQAVFIEQEKPAKEAIISAIEALMNDYMPHAFELIKVASGYKIQTKSEYSSWIGRLNSDKPVKYSRALLETLAIIAYKQPVTRGDVEEIRGVAVSSHIIKTLLERSWIRVAGYRDVPGKPAVFTTTSDFLNYFNLNHLNELPSLPEVVEPIHNLEEECVTE